MHCYLILSTVLATSPKTDSHQGRQKYLTPGNLQMKKVVQFTFIKSGFDIKISPSIPAVSSGRLRGILEIRTATASTNPFSVFSYSKAEYSLMFEDVTKYIIILIMHNYLISQQYIFFDLRHLWFS